jgi:hypothetical protein
VYVCSYLFVYGEDGGGIFFRSYCVLSLLSWLERLMKKYKTESVATPPFFCGFDEIGGQERSSRPSVSVQYQTVTDCVIGSPPLGTTHREQGIQAVLRVQVLFILVQTYSHEHDVSMRIYFS